MRRFNYGAQKNEEIVRVKMINKHEIFPLGCRKSQTAKFNLELKQTATATILTKKTSIGSNQEDAGGFAAAQKLKLSHFSSLQSFSLFD